MQVYLQQWQAETGWKGLSEGSPEGSPIDSSAGSRTAPANCSLVLVFGGAGDADLSAALVQLRTDFPEALLLGCSSAGEILGVEVFDDTLTAAAFEFADTQVHSACVTVSAFPGSREAGQALAGALPAQGLRHVLVFSDGLQVNGSDLASGMTQVLPAEVPVTGGLAADGASFSRTQVIYNDRVETGLIGCVGFYGDRLVTSCGSMGGWDVFGPDRVITRSEGNVLFELDGQSALQLYREYLGDYARDLPGSGLLFPLQIQTDDGKERVVRTILGIDEETQSMTFAGDVPEGAKAQLMRANFDRLVDGAIGAAGACDQAPAAAGGWQFGLLISCVGRRMVLQQRIEEELEGVRDVLGVQAPLAGFYSYGEIAPFVRGDSCRLHNQTMTVTAFAELDSA